MESVAFCQLKEAFTSAPILCHWLPDLPMTLETNASNHAIAGILSVTTPNQGIRPITFHSHSLHDAEKNYDTHDKELLATFKSYKVWWHYLEGSALPIDTVTDHKNLEYFTSTKKLTRCKRVNPPTRVQEWSWLQRKEGGNSMFCGLGSGLVLAWQWCVWGSWS